MMDKQKVDAFRDRFDELAVEVNGEYDKSSKPAQVIKNMEKDILYKVLARESFQTVLDIGSGKGYYVPIIKSVAEHVVCVDISFNMLKLSQEMNGDSNTYMQADMGALPFRDGSVSAVFMFDILHYLTDKEREGVIKTSLNLLQDNGKIYIDIKNSLCPYYSVTGWQKNHKSPHAETYSLKSIKRILKDTGASVSVVKSVPAFMLAYAPVLIVCIEKGRKG